MVNTVTEYPNTVSINNSLSSRSFHASVKSAERTRTTKKKGAMLKNIV